MKPVKRRMVVSSVIINCGEEKTQDITLALLTREESDKLDERFPPGSEKRNNGRAVAEYLKQKLRPAGARSIGNLYLDKPGSSLTHVERHHIPGIKYHLGDIFTEEDALKIGYDEPFVFSLAENIGIMARDALYNPNQPKNLTARLRDKGYIYEKEYALFEHNIMAIVHSEDGKFRDDPWIEHGLGRRFVDSGHRVYLELGEPNEQDELYLGGSIYMPSNRIYEVSTFVPKEYWK